MDEVAATRNIKVRYASQYHITEVNESENGSPPSRTAGD